MTKQQLGWAAAGPPELLILEGKSISAPGDMAEAQLRCYENKITRLMDRLPDSNSNPLSTLREAMDNWTGAAARPKFKLHEISLSETV